MNPVFYAIALAMTLAALSFAATPLVLSYRAANRGFARLPLLVAVVAVALAIALYAVIGRPDVPGSAHTVAASPARMQTAGGTGDGSKAASIGSLLGGLEARLQEQPDDAGGWLLLAKSYDQLGRRDEARAAYEKAVALGTTDDAFAAKLDSAAAAPPVEIRGRISVDGGAAGRIDPADVVFIVARVPGESMPLAVLRRSAAELPFDFVLSDASSMVQGRGLGSVPMVTVSAKVSRTGNALDESTDLQAAGRTLATGGDAFVELTIGAASDLN